MSILKTLLVAALVAATASGCTARPSPRRAGRCMYVCDETATDAAATPEAADLSEALAVASDAVEALASESLSGSEQAAVGAEIVENIAAAVEIAADDPQAQEVQADVVEQKGAEFFDELEKNLFFAKKYQKALAKFGTTMSADEVIEHQTSLQSFLEKAFFFAQQNFKTFQQVQAIADGEHPADVAAVGTAVTLDLPQAAAAAGRRMRGGRQKGRTSVVLPCGGWAKGIYC